MSDFIDKRTDAQILSERKTLMIYPEKLRKVFEELLGGDNFDIARLMTSVLDYVIDGSVPDFSNPDDVRLNAAFFTVKLDIDQDSQKYIKRSRQNSKNQASRWHNTKNTNDTTVSDKSTRTSSGNGSGNGNGYGYGYGHGNGHGRSGNEFLDMLESEAEE